MAEQHYQAVLAVIKDGRTVTETAAAVGVSRQTLHAWLGKYEAGGLEGLVDAPSGGRRRRRREWRRWERGRPNELWQMDVMGGFLLANGSRAKALTGIDDHSRFCVSARLMPRSGRSRCVPG